ncbi:MAG: hypothetical protein KDA80_03255 [Planctomycetaceae bacterium]|nr:hypothetical protein [Planctomycetaceae bacterium]
MQSLIVKELESGFDQSLEGIAPFRRLPGFHDEEDGDSVTSGEILIPIVLVAHVLIWWGAVEWFLGKSRWWHWVPVAVMAFAVPIVIADVAFAWKREWGPALLAIWEIVGLLGAIARFRYGVRIQKSG